MIEQRSRRYLRPWSEFSHTSAQSDAGDVLCMGMNICYLHIVTNLKVFQSAPQVVASSHWFTQLNLRKIIPFPTQLWDVRVEQSITPILSVPSCLFIMDPYYATKKHPSSRRGRSGTALFSLVLLGCGIVFFGIVMIACAFVINYAEDFETSPYGGIEAKVQSEFTYSQYWAGIPVSTHVNVLLIFLPESRKHIIFCCFRFGLDN